MTAGAGARQAALRTEACLASNSWQLSESKESYVGGCGLFVLMLSHAEMNQRHRVMEALHAAQLDTKKKSQVRGARHAACCPPARSRPLPPCPEALELFAWPAPAAGNCVVAGAASNLCGRYWVCGRGRCRGGCLVARVPAHVPRRMHLRSGWRTRSGSSWRPWPPTSRRQRQPQPPWATPMPRLTARAKRAKRRTRVARALRAATLARTTTTTRMTAPGRVTSRTNCCRHAAPACPKRPKCLMRLAPALAPALAPRHVPGAVRACRRGKGKGRARQSAALPLR